MINNMLLSAFIMRVTMLLLILVTGMYHESCAVETLLALHENLHEISRPTLQQIQNKTYAAISENHRKGGLNNTELEALFNILKYDLAEALGVELILFGNSVTYPEKPADMERSLTYISPTERLFPESQHEHYNLEDFLKASANNQDKQIAEILEELTSRYKIHLMPQKHHIPEILYKFLKETKNNTPLREAIMGFKFYVTEPEKSKQRVPTIVIYAQPSKQQAQTVLDEIYRLFKEYPGVDAIGPRWNTRVTNLIWWAQGDGDYKKSTWKAYPAFQEYLGKDFIKNLYVPGDDEGNGHATFRANITGTDMEYALRNPAKEAPK